MQLHELMKQLEVEEKPHELSTPVVSSAFHVCACAPPPRDMRIPISKTIEISEREWGSEAGRSARPTHRLHDDARIEMEGLEQRAHVMVVLYFEPAELLSCAKEGFTPPRNKETSDNCMHAGDGGSG
jgi:hypothetical protein